MKALLALVVLAALGVTGAAHAAGSARAHHSKAHWRAAKVHHVVPAPWSWRARKIRAADSCWRGCQAEAGRGFQACLHHAGANRCVRANDVADRFCLRACRLSGGPFLKLAD